NNKKTADTLSEQNALEIRDWVALGSGCRGSKKEPGGNVNVEVKPVPNVPDRYIIKVYIPDYALSGDVPITPDKPTFARECSLRMATYPQKGWQIHMISADMKIDARKSALARLLLTSRIAFANGSLGKWEKELTNDQSTHLTQMVHVVP